jgi:plastocyanin
MAGRTARWVLLGTILLATAMPADAGIEASVSVDDNVFDPNVVPSLLAGDAVRWEWIGNGTHNVRQVGGLFRSALSNDPGTLYTRTFSSGTFPYECEIHEPLMIGTVEVELWQGTSPSGLPLIKWAFPDSNTGRAFDVKFRIGDGPWRAWRTDTTSLGGVFGRNDRPVHFNPAKEYWFRARSQKGLNTPTKISRWSPPTLND